MERGNTKQRILDASLDLFSVQGFDGVSIKEIAGRVGIKDSSLYKHFPSKQAIFDTLFEEMNTRFEETVASYRLPQGEIRKVAKEYGRNDLTWLKKACEAVFLFFLKDPRASKFRRLLMIEQYKNGAAAAAFRSWFTDAAMEFQTALFTEMIKQGAFRKGPPATMALQFYAPFYLLLFQYDTMPEKTGEALAVLMAHVEQFAAVYQIPQKERKK
ncbi:TetR/AcrR family transcriptional regulator [Breznakiella homolactica]|uniref:TetR/AcrR family transcriptional regulator n=1 Tax=Breznakiella homolactica TaxID=2798577 RepID=A0A7T8BA84_9SPIR|nr:TetR/AcrR family transcriptional regulator [Breznakiella homolactica]QQO08735.1 TetR/AcrR family transcriptional regulator [Breznakiella homolactica]